MPDTIAEIEVCTIADIGLTLTGPDAAPVIAAVNEYLSMFMQPDGNACLKCGAQLGGLLGSFVWGIATGEGRCSQCDWPARAHHYPRDADGEPFFNRPIEVILQYHPDHVTVRSQEQADGTPVH